MNTLAGGKQGVRLAPTWAALRHPGSGAALDAGGLAIGDEAVASGVPPGALLLVRGERGANLARTLARPRARHHQAGPRDIPSNLH
jgi:hypothetical protein